MAAGIFDVRGAGAAFQNLKRLATGLQVWPESIYTWAQLMSRKYGVNTTGVGSQQQVNRLRPLTAPDPANLGAYTLAQSRNAVSTLAANLQTLDYDSVTIDVFERGMAGTGANDGPLAIKKQSLALAQQDIMQHAQIVLKRNYNEYLNFSCRETIRNAVSNTLFGNFRASAATVTNAPADNLSLLMVKEMKRRFVKAKVRKFGDYPNGDGQMLKGSWCAIYDVDGENQITNDAVWREFAKFSVEGREEFAVGYSGDYSGFSFYRTDTGATATAGASGQINCGELIVLGVDPTLIEPPDGGSQGFVGEFPTVFAQVGPVEVVRAKEDNFERDWLVTWFAIQGFAALETLSSGDASTITTQVGNSTTYSSGGSRFVGKAIYSTVTV